MADIPTKEDINVHNSLDEISASENFFGLNLQEAEALFARNSLAYIWDLMWMGPKAFSYYVKAAHSYVKSKEADGDSDVVDGLAKIIDFRCRENDLGSARSDVLDLANYIIENFERFDVDESVYGDLKSQYVSLKIDLAK